MGLYDRDYLQDDYGSPQRASFNTQTMVIKLLILNAGIYLLELFLAQREPGRTNFWFCNILAAQPEVLTQPWLWWKLLTYGFAHDPANIGHVFWNMFGVFVFGREIETHYGAKEFLRIYLTAIVLGGLFWCTREYLTAPESNSYLIGASGAVTAIVLLFVFNFPKRTILLMFVLPVPAWVVGLMFVGGDIMMLLRSDGDMSIAVDVHFVGAAFAVAYFFLGWNLGRISPSFAWLRGGFPKFKRRPKLKVHDPDAAQHYDAQDDEADRILDKVNQKGIDSLSKKERRILEEYSRRMREKHR